MTALLIVAALPIVAVAIGAAVRYAHPDNRTVWACGRCGASDTEPTDTLAADALRWHRDVLHYEADVR